MPAIQSTAPLQEDLLAHIDERPDRVWRPQLATLMVRFGFQANQRVRRTSLDLVMSQLAAMGIELQVPAEPTPRSRVQVRRATPDPHGRASIPADQGTGQSPGCAGLGIAQLADPVAQRFDWEPDNDWRAAIWAGIPVLLHVDAKVTPDAFNFLGGYIAAIMRRRRTQIGDRPLPTAPQVIDQQSLTWLAGPAPDGFSPENSLQGVVLLLPRQDADLVDLDLLARLREVNLSHTYRVAERDGFADHRSEWLAALGHWLGVFAGGAEVRPVAEAVASPGAWLADAVQARDALQDRWAGRPKPAGFHAGYESAEHIVLKAAAHDFLLRRGETARVEAHLRTDVLGDEEPVEGNVAAKRADLMVEHKYWVEVETTRGLGSMGGDPFLLLERKMLDRAAQLANRREELWLIVPSDLAALNPNRIAAVCDSLAAAAGRPAVRWGYMDLGSGTPVLVHGHAAPVHDRPTITGRPWSDNQPTKPSNRTGGLAGVAGCSALVTKLRREFCDPLSNSEKLAAARLPTPAGLLLFGLPGCGKSLIARSIADELGLQHRALLPSDLTSKWLGESVEKIRAMFDWALQQDNCLLVLDELDAVAPQRRDVNMHTDEMRTVNELLVQLDRVTEAGRNVTLIATTNYPEGIDAALRRSGRFDLRLPVFPPDRAGREEVLNYYLGKLHIPGTRDVDVAAIAVDTQLFTPADLEAGVQAAARTAVLDGKDLTTALIKQHLSDRRSLTRRQCELWLRQMRDDGGQADELNRFSDELASTWPKK